VPAWAAPQAAKVKARIGAISQRPVSRIVARGLYESGKCESIRGVLTLFAP
jgi:hypothetical protein